MNAPFDYLLDHAETPSRIQRERTRGTWHSIHPETLLNQYGDPSLALAAAIVQITANDIRANSHRNECFAFLKSEWFHLIARGLEFRTETLHALNNLS